MHGTTTVVVNGVTAKQIDQKSVEFRHSDPGSTFSPKPFMERRWSRPMSFSGLDPRALLHLEKLVRLDSSIGDVRWREIH